MNPVRKLFGTLAGVLLAALLAACGGPKFDALPAGSKVLVIGDSITAGYGFTPEQAWTQELARQSGWQVINAGVSGDTSEGGRARLPALLEEHRPQAVIVELGGNDMLRRFPQTTTVANLEAMLDLAAAAGARPVLMATPRPSAVGAAVGKLSDAPFYAEIAKHRKVPLLADVLADTLSKNDYKIDALHPNLEGHRRIGSDATAALRKLGLLR